VETLIGVGPTTMKSQKILLLLGFNYGETEPMMPAQTVLKFNSLRTIVEI